MEIDNRLYYQIAAWMINDLHLKGKELQCYAVIYSLSQLGQGWYNAGLEFLAKFMQVSQPTASSAIDGLLKKGLIDKKAIITETGRRVVYFCVDGVNKNFMDGVNKNFMDGVNKNFMVPNKYNIIEFKDKNKKLSNDNKKSDFSFEDFWKKYRKGNKQSALKQWEKLKEKEKEQAINTVDDYLLFCKRSGRTLKDTSSYICQKYFDNDWNIIPDYYQVNDHDNERLVKFKKWICKDYPDLIYHRNPLTFEQADELFEEYSVGDVKRAMRYLCTIDIHQYFNIKSGIKTILETEDLDSEI